MMGYFSHGEISYAIVGEVKNPNVFSPGRADFPRGTFRGGFRRGAETQYCEIVCLI